MPNQIPRAREHPERVAAEAPHEVEFDVSRLHSLPEARAYREWKTEAPAAVRQAVESAILGKVKTPESTGLPRVDAFLHALSGQLADPNKAPTALPESLHGLFESLRSTPKMNAHCERFNRTIQEEYINYHKGEMIDLHRFNLKLFDWLVWYNAERPHWSLNLQSPIQFLTEWNRGKSRMDWPDTFH